MDDGSNGNIFHREAIPRLYRSFRPVLDLQTFSHPFRRKNVSLLAVCILYQRDIGTAVRVVLYRSYNAGDADLVPAKIDLPIFPLNSPTLATNADSSVSIPARPKRSPFCQRLFCRVIREFIEQQTRFEPQAGRKRLIGFNSHGLYS